MRAGFLLCLLGAQVVPTAVMAASPFDGTWKEDSATATFSKEPMTFVIKDGMFDCMTCTPAIHVRADGTDQTVSGHPGFDAVAVKVIDAGTFSEINKRAGKVVTDETITVGPGGTSAVVKWSDTSSTAPVTGTTNLVRVAAGPAGSHAGSGSWNVASVANMSDSGSIMTFKMAGGALSFSTPQGLSYTAKLDGTQAPFMGDPAVTTVSLKTMGAQAIQETDYHDGKALTVVTMKVDADGKAMSILYADKLNGRTAAFKAMKQ